MIATDGERFSLGEMDREERVFGLFMVFALASGAWAHLLPAVLPITKVTTDILLLGICGTLLWLLYRRNRDLRLFYWSAAAYTGTFFIEVAGVATGMIFGEYHYGGTMWLQWLNVPLVIALNWTALILATNDLAARWLRQPLAISVLASVLIMAYDLCIEPVAVRLDYWQWAGGVIPVQNYLAWGIVALVFSIPLNYSRIAYRSPLLPIYALAQLFFFLVLLFFYK